MTGSIIGMEKIVKIFANLEDLLIINEELEKKLVRAPGSKTFCDRHAC